MSDTFIVTIPYAVASKKGLLTFDDADKRLWQYVSNYCFEHDQHSKYTITLSEWEEVTYEKRYGNIPMPAGVRRSDIYQYKRTATVELSNPKHFIPQL